MNTIKLYNLEEAATILGCTPTWYNKQLRQGKFPGHKIGKKWMLTLEDILETIELTAKPALTINTKGMTNTSWKRINHNHPKAASIAAAPKAAERRSK